MLDLFCRDFDSALRFAFGDELKVFFLRQLLSLAEDLKFPNLFFLISFVHSDILLELYDLIRTVLEERSLFIQLLHHLLNLVGILVLGSPCLSRFVHHHDQADHVKFLLEYPLLKEQSLLVEG